MMQTNISKTAGLSRIQSCNPGDPAAVQGYGDATSSNSQRAD